MEIENFTFQLLMERLEWPDMLVREQTYHALKDFMIKNCDYKDIFITKLKTQILESRILDLLVIVYLVNQEIENYFEYNLIVNSINKPSFLSQVIITYIFKKSTDNYKDDLWYKNYSLNYPIKYINKNNIKKFYVDNELNKLCMLCNNKLPIYDWFYYEYDKYADIFYNTNDYEYFYDDRYLSYANIKTLEADIQISAILKLFSFLYDNYDFPINIAQYLFNYYMPVDFGLLLLRPSQKPNFLKDIEFFNIESWKYKKEEFIPIYLSCPIKMDINKYDNKEIIGIEALPIFLKDGVEVNADVYNEYKQDLMQQGNVTPLVCDIRNIKFNGNFQGKNIGLLYKSYNYVQRLYSCENNLFIPSDNNICIVINSDKLIFKINNNIIGYLQYWYDNYTSYTYFNTIPCSGVIVYLSENYIKDLNLNKNLYIVCNYKKFVSENMQPFTNSINEYKKFEIYKI